MRYRDNSKLLLLWKLIVTLTTAPILGVVPQNAWPVAEITAVSADAMPTEAKVTMKKVNRVLRLLQPIAECFMRRLLRRPDERFRLGSKPSHTS
jgi:hypothetical protein